MHQFVDLLVNKTFWFKQDAILSEKSPQDILRVSILVCCIHDMADKGFDYIIIYYPGHTQNTGFWIRVKHLP